MVMGNVCVERSANGGAWQAAQAKLSHGPELDTGGKTAVFRKLVSFGKAKAASPRSEKQ